MTKIQTDKINKLMPLIDAIKKRCLDCSAGSIYEVKMCVCEDCALFPYRNGINFKTSKSPCKKAEGSVKIDSTEDLNP